MGSGRYRAIISDGEHFDQSFIGGSSHHYFSNGIMQTYQVIKIKNYTITDVNSASLITLNEIEPSSIQKAVIGSPVMYENKPKRVEQKPPQKPVISNKDKDKENIELTSVKALTSNSKEFSIKFSEKSEFSFNLLDNITLIFTP